MTIAYQDDLVTVHHGDALQVLAELPAGSIDAVVTDPPYGIGFMGHQWDQPGDFGPIRSNGTPRARHRDGDALEAGRYDLSGAANVRFQQWCTEWTAQCFRLLKPGGHLLAFGGARTWHRLAAAVEDAGFEIRDSIAWLYGQGFPKSRDVSAAMDTFQAGTYAGPAAPSSEVYEITAFLRAARDAAGWSNRQIDALFETNGMAGHWTSQASQPAVPSPARWAVLKERLRFGDEMDAAVARLGATDRPEDWGTNPTAARFLAGADRLAYTDAPAAGPWGTALKPAFEPVVVGRKPVVGSITANVAQYGTGALNIDGTRIPIAPGDDHPREDAAGRWPTNVLTDDHAARVIGLEQARRFFPAFRYEPKPATSERPKVGEVTHPTVKPLALMQWLCRLVTPPGGTVLEPFAGSGTTVEAAVREGFSCVAVEREADYLPLIRSRMSRPVDLVFQFEDGPE